MARVLIIYGTTNGQTGKIARFVGEQLRVHGHQTDVIDARGATVSPDDYAGVIVAASVHAGGYQKRLRRWVRAHAQALASRPNAFVSVCLGVLQKDPKVDADLRRMVEEFVTTTGWQPDAVKVIAGALPYTQYDVVTRWFMKRIVSKAGGDTDTTRDYEYTDWNEVHAFADKFASRLGSLAPKSAA